MRDIVNIHLKMPKLIHHKRGHHPAPMLSYPVLQNAGTRLSLRERNIAYKIGCLAVIAADGGPTKY